MLKRTALIALAAVATIGLASLNASDAFAKPNHGGNGKLTQKGKGGHGGHGHHGHGHHGHGHHGHKHVKVHVHYKQWHRYSVVRPIVTTAYTRPTYTAPTCTCLTKEYLPNGAVLFKDVCTNEAAMNPPNEQAATSQSSQTSN